MTTWGVLWGLKAMLGLGLGEGCIQFTPRQGHVTLLPPAPLVLCHTPQSSFWARNAFWAARGVGGARG